MANKPIVQITSLPRKWVIKSKEGFYIEPCSSGMYIRVLQYEADAFRYTEGEAIDFLTAFPKLKEECSIIQVTR